MSNLTNSKRVPAGAPKHKAREGAESEESYYKQPMHPHAPHGTGAPAEPVLVHARKCAHQASTFYTGPCA